MVYFDDCGLYIQSQTSLKAKIDACEVIINKLFDTMAAAAVNGMTDEYMLDDGQTVIKTKYRDLNQIEAAINGFRRLQNIYIKQYNKTGVVRAMDNKNFFPRIF